MARLTANGIRFSTDNELNSRRQIFALNAAWTFYQNTTPTGWTKVPDHNNKALRVVSGAGGGSGGTNSFTSTFSPKTIGGTIDYTTSGGSTFLNISQIAIHQHSNNNEIGVSPNPSVFNPDGTQTGYSAGDVRRPPSGNSAWLRNSPSTDTAGSGDDHSHPAGTASVAAPNQTVTLDFRYIDIIVCTFNG